MNVFHFKKYLVGGKIPDSGEGVLGPSNQGADLQSVLMNFFQYQLVDQMISQIPGADSVVDCPDGDCIPDEGYFDTLPEMIMHLNDTHRWAREEIADWLDTLDIDLTIQVWG